MPPYLTRASEMTGDLGSPRAMGTVATRRFEWEFSGWSGGVGVGRLTAMKGKGLRAKIPGSESAAAHIVVLLSSATDHAPPREAVLPKREG